MIKWLWPGQEEWKGWLLNSPRPLKGKNATDWTTDRIQQIGDTFYLDIEKRPDRFILALLNITSKVFKKLRPWNYGKARVIDLIKFRRGDHSAAETPRRYAVTIQGETSILPGWEEKEQIQPSFGHFPTIHLERPEKVVGIAIKIIEPSLGVPWSVGEIRIREVRLFRKCWRTDIGNLL